MIGSVHGNLDGLRSSMVETGRRAGADSGDPKVRFAEMYDQEGREAGMWACTPGGWAIENRPDTEAVLILSGEATITDADGTATTVGPGDFFVLPRGWSGRWDILETVEKLYVIS
ncbi:MAG: DUF861 domain-containing protein [Acidimicrobiia bacterium]|nr:DUF861 domain-containing protein [Acidimicrobiia bacterium]